MCSSAKRAKVRSALIARETERLECDRRRREMYRSTVPGVTFPMARTERESSHERKASRSRLYAAIVLDERPAST